MKLGRERRVKRGWMSLKVSEVVDETHDTKTFWLSDAEVGSIGFDYAPGQYLTFRFDGLDARPLVRSYTMSSSPSHRGDQVAVTVKRVDGGRISNWMCDELVPDAILRARGPIGRFCYDPEADARHLFMVAGGSGVTPFVAIIREAYAHLGQPGYPERLTLLVSHRTRNDLILARDLDAALSHPQVRVITTLTRETHPDYWHGRIDDTMLERAIAGDYANTTFMTCGPEAIMQATQAHLEAHGVAPERFKQESFEN